MTTSNEHQDSPAKGGPEAPPKEPILMNWIIIFVTIGLILAAAYMLKGF